MTKSIIKKSLFIRKCILIFVFFISFLNLNKVIIFRELFSFGYKFKNLVFYTVFILTLSLLSCTNLQKTAEEYQYTQEYKPNSKALVIYKSDNIKGYKNKPVIIDYYFIPVIKRINNYAKNYNVILYVTSSFRTPESQKNLSGAIVRPSNMSNHLAGHAIDVNIVYNNKWYNSDSLSRNNFKNLPYNVKAFISSLRLDLYIRWGGDFSTEDPVHIDDSWNSNVSKWHERYLICQRTYTNSINSRK